MLNVFTKKNTYSIENIERDFFERKNWHYNKKNLQVFFDDTNIIIASKNKRVSYMSLFNNDTNFNTLKKNRIILNNDNNIIKISGKQSGNIKVIIYLIEYDKKLKRVRTNKLLLNEVNNIKPLHNSRYARIAIRITGIGELHINNLSLIDTSGSSQVDTISKKMNDVNVACILDEFSMACFKDVVHLIPVSLNNWMRELEINKPDILFVESAWNGNNGQWRGEIATYNKNNGNYKLKQLINWCKENNIPTVFWNKEDPVHFDRFKRTARLFDYIFTTDADMVSKYKKLNRDNNAYSLQFAANPIIHNPILKEEKKKRISFAGSYYSNRHAERKKDMDDVLRIAKEFGLDIFDRNYEKNKENKNSDFSFPSEFQENIVGSLKYHEIDKAYKSYRVVLNVNSVKYSPTMFSRRVFESLACGTPVVSSYSVGLKKTFGDLVLIYENDSQFREQLRQLMTNDILYNKKSIDGIRNVMNNHTYKHRMEKILDIVKINYIKDKDDISVLFYISSIEEFNNALNIFKKQTYNNKKAVFLLDVFEGFEEILNKYNNNQFTSYLINYAFKREYLSDIIDTKYVTVLNLGHQYGKYYLEDLIHAGVYSNADIIGKKSLENKMDDENNVYENQFVNNIIPDTAIYKIESVKYRHLREILFNKEGLIKELFHKEGKVIFSGNKYNFMLNNESNTGEN